MILAIDPGKHAFGCAWFGGLGSRLLHAAYVPAERLAEEVSRFKVLSKFYLERQYLPKNHPRPMDIVELSFGAGFAKGIVTALHVTEVVEVLPVVWKGNVPKPIMTERILSKLDTQELAKIVRVGHKDHNTIDAIGIGLYGLGRLK